MESLPESDDEAFDRLLGSCLPHGGEPLQAAPMGAPKPLPQLADLQQLATLCRKGFIRDIEFSAELFDSAASLTSRAWKTASAKQSPIGQGSDGRRKGQGRSIGLRGQMCGAGSQQPVTTAKPMTVAPWAKPMSQGGMPATVAPWAKNVNVSASLGAVKRSAESQELGCTDVPFERALAASQILGYIVATPEAADFALIAPDRTLASVMAVGEMVSKRLSGIGGNTGDGEHCDGRPEAAEALRDVLYQVYRVFPRCRRILRDTISKVCCAPLQLLLTCGTQAVINTVTRARTVSPQMMGVRLGVLDGGNRRAELSLVGVVKLLEVLSSVIRGFRKPVLQSHQAVLWGCLIPLHANSAMVDDLNTVLSLYHAPLMRCITSFLEKDGSLTASLLQQMIECWPDTRMANSGVEVLLLHGLEALIEAADPAALSDSAICDSVFQLVARCIRGDKNFKVAQRALSMFKSDQFNNFVMQHRATVVPQLIPALVIASREHWNASAKKMCGAAVQVIDLMDPEFFEQCCASIGHDVGALRSAALSLNPTVDLAAEKQAKQNLLTKTRAQANLNLYSVAVGHELATGSFAKVKYGKLILRNVPQGQWPEVAVKLMDLELLRAQGYTENVARESKILQAARHPGIVQYIGQFETPSSLWLVLEYAAGGDLQQVLERLGSLSAEATVFVAAQVLLALEYLHEELQVVYGDLKPENVLRDSFGHLKLSDFGSAVYASQHELTAAAAETTEVLRVEGTADYVAPEVATGHSTGQITFASDAWALGCVTFQLLAGHTPVTAEEGESNSCTLQRVVQFATEQESAADIFPESFADHIKPLVRTLLSKDPSARLGSSKGSRWAEIKQSDAFEGIDCWDSLFTSEPVQLGCGAVTAATAADRRWNRRKQSMMWAPMPVKYRCHATPLSSQTLTWCSFGGSSELPAITEEDPSVNFIKKAPTAASGAAPGAA